VDGKGDKLRM
jgi:hypothetical protein